MIRQNDGYTQSKGKQMLELNKIYNMDWIEGLNLLDNNSIDCCITSPPYWGLRDYGQDDQLGLEKTPDDYVAKMVLGFREVKRVLKPEGTLWLNLGDSYSKSESNNGGYSEKSTLSGFTNPNTKGRQANESCNKRKLNHGCKPKDLVGIPWMVAFALRNDGWYLRQDIIWHKPNPMPESVRDRCTKSHEYIFLMSKSSKYYYNNEAIREPIKTSNKGYISARARTAQGALGGKNKHNMERRDYEDIKGANKRSVWTITTKPFKDAHFAVFPEDLIRPCILAGCPKDGIILDPFMGAGTTALVSIKEQRNFIGIELNSEYIKIASDRIQPELAQLRLDGD